MSPIGLNTNTALHRMVKVDEMYYRIYERYQPDLASIVQIHEAQPVAHVITASRHTCPDCARHVPRMARIAEHLPGWTWDMLDSHADPERAAALGIVRVPTFIVYGEDGREIGRIVEHPASGSLEADLLRLVGAAQP